MKDVIEWENIKELLKEKTGLSYFNSSRTELICSCPWCEPFSNKGHGHLYISMDPNYLVFNCFRCEKNGPLIRLIKKCEGDPSKYIDDNLVRINSNTRISNIRGISYKKNYYFDEDIYSDINRQKRSYILGRIGYNVDLSLIPNMIFSIKTFIRHNNIELNNYDLDKIDLLERYYIGFVCNRNTQIVFRCICNEFREYEKIKLSESVLKDFYGLKLNSIDDKISNIVISEGIFDILVPYFSEEFFELKQSSCCWCACLGKGFEKSLKSIMEYYMISRFNLIVFADNDMKNYRFTNIDNSCINSIHVFRNRLGKDFGKHPISITKNSFNRRYF